MELTDAQVAEYKRLYDPPYFPKVFDSSMMATLKTCPQLFKKVYIDDWKSKEPSVHLHAGGAFAKALEVARDAFYVKEHTANDSLTLGVKALIAAYGDYQCPADSPKSLIRMAGALEYYFSHYPLNHNSAYPIIVPGNKRGIEFSFAHPLPIAHPVTGEPIIYCGRADAIMNYAGGVFVFDEKTTGRLGKSWSEQWDLRSQFTGYAWGCREAGIDVAGVVVRGIAIYKDRYECAEAICYRPEWEIARWYAELLEWISEAIGWWKTGRYRYNLDNSCTHYGGCGFASVCSRKDEQPWLETYFEKRRWDPILREEKAIGTGTALPITGS